MAETYHTWYHSPIGLLKISGTEDYISEVSFHDTSQKPEGNKKHIPPMLIQCAEQLIQYFNGQRRQFELPLNQEGTIFQQQVWNELQQIPFGKTISYLELARRIGDTKATRAVANANGKNNIAVIVPCHRGMPVAYTGRNGCWTLKPKLRMGCRPCFKDRI